MYTSTTLGTANASDGRASITSERPSIWSTASADLAHHPSGSVATMTHPAEMGAHLVPPVVIEKPSPERETPSPPGSEEDVMLPIAL
jgi:hypothetical protein